MGAVRATKIERYALEVDVSNQQAGNQEIDGNKEAFCHLREELSRSLMLVRQYHSPQHFGDLVRMTNELNCQIARTKVATSSPE
jgi:hypothetical protein